MCYAETCRRSTLKLLLLPLPLLSLFLSLCRSISVRQAVSFFFLFFFRSAREEGERTRETAKWDIRNILDSTARPRIGRQVSWFFFFSLLLFQPDDINPNPSFFSRFRDKEGVGRIVAEARRAWPGRVEFPCEIEPSKKFRNRALNSGSVRSGQACPRLFTWY